MSKVYLVSKKAGTVGVVFNQAENKATRIQFKADQTLGYSNSGISAVLETLKMFPEEGNGEVNTIYVTSQVYDTIVNQNYKFWLMTGTNRNGEVIEENVLELFRELNEQLKAKGDYFVFRELVKCFINDKVKANPKSFAKFSIESKANDNYARYCQKEAEKAFPTVTDFAEPTA